MERTRPTQPLSVLGAEAQESSTKVQFLRCRHCSAPYRKPGWNRAYLCGACGLPLDRAAPRAPRKLPIWPLYLVGATLLVAGLLQLAADRFKQDPRFDRNRPTAVVRRRTWPVVPPQLAQVLTEKQQWLEAELASASSDPAVLVRLVELHLHRAVLVRTGADPTGTADRDLRRAEQLVRQLANIAPEAAEFLSLATSMGARLQWGSGRTGNVYSAGPQLDGDAQEVRLASIDSVWSPGLMSVQDPLERSQMLLGPMPGQRQEESPLGGGNGDSAVSQERAAARRRERLQYEMRHPLQAAEWFGAGTHFLEICRTIRTQGSSRLTNPRMRPWAEAATDFLQRGLRLSRSRLEKAIINGALADAWSLLGEHERQFEFASTATRTYPYSAALWMRLQDASRRLGREAEQLQAWNRVKDLSVPDLVAQ